MSYLLARDTVNGAEGKIFITLDGKSIEVACMKNITVNAEIQGEDMRVIGTRTIQNKLNGAKLTGSGNIYYGSNLFTDMVLQYINTGNMPLFDIQITNKDPENTIGAQTIAYYGCKLSGTIPLSILNDEESMLNYDFEFTYTSVARLEAFQDPQVLGN